MRVAMFYHSLVSDWNHGNAHFLRGIVSELQAGGHGVRVFEPEDGWSRMNLLQDAGPAALDDFHRAFPKLTSTMYSTNRLATSEWLDDADLALVHEWNDPHLISAIGRYRKANPQLRIFFHDTHHRAVTAPDELAGFLARCPVKVVGLMTMPPLATSPEQSRPHFAALRRLAGEHGLHHLSMGTSQDYLIAIQEGATIIRLGTTLYDAAGAS